MSDFALRTTDLGKMYRIGGERGKNPTLRDALAQAVRRPIERILHPGAATHHSEVLWALRNVDLEVLHGETLGIIGRNGAGKSTLLKLLSHITEPTEGRIEIRGRVGSLLEVGTGFHPELTGRENIMLNGAILGMSRAEVKSKFDEIVEFSEVSRFLDTPVKRYSSGMYVRLAFAVAAHLDPDVLIVDEVLAVGDVAFQRKCLGKMEDVAGRGRTVLFVSHNMQTVRSLCSRAIELVDGRVVNSGDTASVVSDYMSRVAQIVPSVTWQPHEGPGNHQIRFRGAHIVDSSGQRTNMIGTAEPVTIRLEFDLGLVGDEQAIGVELVNSDGLVMMRSFHKDPEPGRIPQLVEGHNVLDCLVPGALLNEGRYFVRLVARFGTTLVAHTDEVISFETHMNHAVSPFSHEPRRGALLFPILEWQTADEGSQE
jgi:lipopolysaccharide transport system ATP-binding protein